jgi:hypothetical protein
MLGGSENSKHYIGALEASSNFPVISELYVWLDRTDCMLVTDLTLGEAREHRRGNKNVG